MLTLIKAGAVDGFLLFRARGGHYFWFPVEKVVRSRPEWVCELVAAYLERLLIVADQSGNMQEFPLKHLWDGTGEKVIAEAANAAPQRFVELLLPPMTAIMEMAADRSQDPPWRDRVWGHGVIALKDGLDNPSPHGVGIISALDGGERT